MPQNIVIVYYYKGFYDDLKYISIPCLWSEKNTCEENDIITPYYMIWCSFVQCPSKAAKMNSCIEYREQTTMNLIFFYNNICNIY